MEHKRHAFEDVDSFGDQLLASLVVICLIGLGLGESHLMIPSLCSLVIFSLVSNFLFFSFSCLYYLTSLFSSCIK